MSNSDPTLEQFIKFVPSCESLETLETLLLSFQHHQRDFVVVVNDKHQPLGIVTAITLLQRKIIEEASLSRMTDLLSPVVNVCDQMTVKALLPDLERVAIDEKILVVNQKGQLRGQLDTEGILQVCLKEHNRPFQGDLTAFLWDFLEKLPLPLMVQTEQGKVIHQNASWRNNICSQTEQCCFLTADAPKKTEKQWCNVIGESAVACSTQECSSQPLESKGCPLFLLSGHSTENVSGKTSGVWQFITLNLPESTFGSMFLVLATDITEQRQLCKELAAKNADLVQLNRLKDEFLACITHELKSPLTAIVGLSNLLNEKSLGQLNERQQRYVNQIHQSGRQLMNLVNDLLDLARLETGQLPLHREVVKLKQVCDRAYEEAAQQTPQSNAQGTISIQPNLETIVADELRLRQMLVHLLSNARKFTTDEGKMGLEVSEWEGWIAFTVWDTGIGIPEESQHLIFQKFQQLEDPMTRQFSGTGLGLVLTQRLAHAHGGDVSFISEEGKGSQFTLLLPPTPAPKTNKTALQGKPAVGKLVLVVEAVPRYVKGIIQQLRELGYRVAIARSGTEALLKARTFQPSTIILNPVLPLLSGWDVLTLLKSHPSSYHLPVIVTATRGEKQQAMDNGADAFLTLPVESESLKNALEACAAPRSLYRQSLTVLRLHYSETTSETPSPDPITEWLNVPDPSQSQQINYRILEADDPEQAELLQRIWHPDVLLLTGTNIPQTYLEQLSQQESLPQLPLVCLEVETARLAHQMGNLSVYPCLNLNQPNPGQTLWSVLKFAGGITPYGRRHSVPYIVIIDGSGLNTTVSSPSRLEWLNALMQYLASAGYRTSLSHSWKEVHRQVEQQGADLLVLDLEGSDASQEVLDELRQLSEIKNLPIIALASPTQLEQNQALHHLLQEVATDIISGHPHSMRELFANLEQQLTN